MDMDALKKADDAIMRHRKRREPNQVSQVNQVSKASTIEVAGVTVAGVDYVDDKIMTLRDDFNDVLDTLPAAGPRQIEIVQSDQVVGKVDGLTHRQFDQLLRLCSLRVMNVLIKGEMGGGKSTAVKQVAEALGLEFGYIGQTLMPHDVVGYVMQATGEHKGTVFTHIYEHGGVIVFEEMDSWSPNASLVLNVALANGYLILPDGRRVDRHPDCVIVACTNTWGSGPSAKYVGRNKLDAAFVDRFGARIDWLYDTELEYAMAGNDEVVEIVQTARRNARKMGLNIAISPRSSIDIARMVAAGFTMKEAINMNFAAELDADQRKVVLAGCDV